MVRVQKASDEVLDFVVVLLCISLHVHQLLGAPYKYRAERSLMGLWLARLRNLNSIYTGIAPTPSTKTPGRPKSETPKLGTLLRLSNATMLSSLSSSLSRVCLREIAPVRAICSRYHCSAGSRDLKGLKLAFGNRFVNIMTVRQEVNTPSHFPSTHHRVVLAGVQREGRFISWGVGSNIQYSAGSGSLIGPSP
jgi:hypothetical protein